MLSTPVQAAADRVAQLTGAKRALLAVFAGAISVLAFAPIHAWQVLVVSFGLLVWMLDGCHARNSTLGDRLRCAALTGFWFGFGYFFTGLYWIAEAFLVEPWRHGWLIPFVMTAMPGGMALFYAAAAALAMMLWRPGAARVFALATASPNTPAAMSSPDCPGISWVTGLRRRFPQCRRQPFSVPMP